MMAEKNNGMQNVTFWLTTKTKVHTQPTTVAIHAQ